MKVFSPSEHNIQDVSKIWLTIERDSRIKEGHLKVKERYMEVQEGFTPACTSPSWACTNPRGMNDGLVISF
jgi:hypothetical protein